MTSANEGGEIVAFPNRASVKAEAGAWLARLDQSALSAEDRAEFRAWIERSREHRECLVTMARAFDSMAVLEELADMFPLAEVSVEKAPQGGHDLNDVMSWIFRPPVVAAALAAGLALAIAITRFLPVDASRQEEFATAIGERARHTLEDGSVIMLNTDSRVSVSYTDNWRTVYLIKGEASFDVTKDSRRHFVVHAGSGLAEALGTSFNVRLTQDVVDVTVTKGRVWVLTNAAHAAPPDPDQNQTNPTPTQIARGTTDHVVLAAGQSAKFDNVIESVVDKIPAETLVRKLAWHDGAIVFSGETLRDALVEISRYTAKPLVIVDPSIASLRIGGRYKTDDMGALLAALSSNFGIKAVEDSQGRILLFAQQG